MSQRNVERIIGRLVTDEGFRRRFAAGPEAWARDLDQDGFELNPCEREALQRLDRAAVEALAESLDPRLQKVDLTGGGRR